MTTSDEFHRSTIQSDSHPLTKKIHHSVDKKSFRHKLGTLLESRWADIFILCLVIVDVCLLSVEHGIDSGMFCIDGRREPATGYAPGATVAGGALPGEIMPLASTLPVKVPAGTSFVVPPGYDLALRPRREALANPPPFEGAPHGGEATLPYSGAEATAPGAPPPLLEPAALPPPLDTAAAAADRIAAAYPGRVAVQGGVPPAQQVPEEQATHLFQVASKLGPQLPSQQLLELQGDAAGRRLRGANAPHGSGPEMVRVCEPREGRYSHQIEHWAHVFSVALLAVMLLEIILKIWVHPGEFLRNPLEVLDLFIVATSLFIDAILLPMLVDPLDKAHAELVVALLVVCRIWRVARILHGIVQVVMIQREHSHKLYERIKMLEKKEGELQALQQELARDSVQTAAADKGGRRRG